MGKMIKQNLETDLLGMEIDIRCEIMSRNEAYEEKRGKVKNWGLWVVSLFVFFAGIVSIWTWMSLNLDFKAFFWSSS